MPLEDAMHTVTVTTPRGSAVVLPFLTAEQRDAAVANLSPGLPPEPVEELAAGETQTCGRCQGAGGWNEQKEQSTAGGGKVVVAVWVNCRPCGGTGRTPKR